MHGGLRGDAENKPRSRALCRAIGGCAQGIRAHTVVSDALPRAPYYGSVVSAELRCGVITGAAERSRFNRAWAAFAGTYAPCPAEAGYADTLTIRVHDDTILVHSQRGGREVPAVALDARTLACDLGLLELAMAEDGTATLERGKAYILIRQPNGGLADR